MSTAETAADMAGPEGFESALLAMARRVEPDVVTIANLTRVSAGATLETWAFDAVRETGATPLILRRSPGERAGEAIPLPAEAKVLRAASGQGLAVPKVWHVLSAEDKLGEGFVMGRISGETIPRKIVRDLDEASGRRLVRQLGETLAGIHTLDVDRLPQLPLSDATAQLEAFEADMRRPGLQPRPVFELALKWLKARVPQPVEPRLVHGDFRLGNVIVGEEGLRALLDWEMAHLGDPAEDLAWIQLPPWRFGNLSRPVAGIGDTQDFYAAYMALTGAPVDAERVRFWQVMGSLRWGVATAGMVSWLRGNDPTVERSMIVRRTSESELDLLRMIMERE